MAKTLERDDVPAHRADELLRDLGEPVVVAGVVGDLGEDLLVRAAAEGVGAARDDGAAGERLHGWVLSVGVASRRTSCSNWSSPRNVPYSSMQQMGSKRSWTGRVSARWATSAGVSAAITHSGARLTRPPVITASGRRCASTVTASSWPGSTAVRTGTAVVSSD